ncbi:MAG: GtrA family protein [Muribaculum sp.]|nr:GtrA family protein [Muribaculum sp.]
MKRNLHNARSILNRTAKDKLGSLFQFVKFGAVGAVNTLLSYLITNVGYYGLHLHEQLSNLISFLITVFVSYLLNSRFVFRVKEGDGQPWYKALAKVYASYALTELLLMGILLFVEERLLGIPHYIATFLNLCVTVPVNFILNKFWAYRRQSRAAASLPYLLLTAVAAVCGVIWSVTNLGYDSEYQAAMAYRLLQGDQLLREMWEPHQTSAFVPALLMWIYIRLFHTTTGILLYLQVCGTLIRGALAAALYRLLRADLEKPLSYGVALLWFMIAPKDCAMPEFSNLQLWFSTLLLLCMISYLKSGRLYLLIAGALSLCMEVLAYPSCAIVLVGVWILLALYSPAKRRDLLVFTGTCALTGLAFCAYFLFSMGTDTLFACVAGMLALEPTHTSGVSARLLTYGGNLLEIGLVLLAASAAGLIAALLLKPLFLRIHPKPADSAGDSSRWRKASWMPLWTLCSGMVLLAGFLLNILSAENRYAYSVILLWMIGIGFAGRNALNEREKRLYLCGSIIGGMGFIATLILTDLPLSASVAYGLLAIVFALIPIRRRVECIPPESNRLKKGFRLCFICFIALLAFRCVCIRTPLSGKGQIYSSFSDLSVVRTGPALGIISDEAGVCIQRDSYPEWKEFIRPGDKVWIVGGVVDTLGYLYEDVEVAAPSTMSTPFYSEAVTEYWRLNPDKYPDVIVAESYMGNLSFELLSNPWFLPWLEEEYRPAYVEDGKYWKYYFRSPRTSSATSPTISSTM